MTHKITLQLQTFFSLRHSNYSSKDCNQRVKIRAKSNVQRKCNRVQIQSLSVSCAVFFHAARLIMKPTQHSGEKMCSKTINRDCGAEATLVSFLGSYVTEKDFLPWDEYSTDQAHEGLQRWRAQKQRFLYVSTCQGKQTNPESNPWQWL